MVTICEETHWLKPLDHAHNSETVFAFSGDTIQHLLRSSCGRMHLYSSWEYNVTCLQTSIGSKLSKVFPFGTCGSGASSVNT